MIENATNLTSQMAGFSIWLKLKAFFLESWIGNFLLIIAILVPIVMGVWAKMWHKRSDFYNHFSPSI